MKKCRDCRFYDETNDVSGWCNVYKAGQSGLTDRCPAFAEDNNDVDATLLAANLIEDFLNAKLDSESYIDINVGDVGALVGLLEISGVIPSER